MSLYHYCTIRKGLNLFYKQLIQPRIHLSTCVNTGLGGGERQILARHHHPQCVSDGYAKTWKSVVTAPPTCTHGVGGILPSSQFQCRDTQTLNHFNRRHFCQHIGSNTFLTKPSYVYKPTHQFPAPTQAFKYGDTPTLKNSNSRYFCQRVVTGNASVVNPSYVYKTRHQFPSPTPAFKYRDIPTLNHSNCRYFCQHVGTGNASVVNPSDVYKLKHQFLASTPAFKFRDILTLNHSNCRHLCQHVGTGNTSVVNPSDVYKLKHLMQAPTPALLLGFSGLIPFGAPALYSILTNTCDPSILYAQIAYGSTILAFLGGVRWGMAVGSEVVCLNWLNLGYSVTPSLIAWVGLLLQPNLALICLITGLSCSALVDINLSGYPAWFKSLRFYLSLGATLSLAVSLMYCWKHTRQSMEKEIQGKVGSQ